MCLIRDRFTLRLDSFQSKSHCRGFLPYRGPQKNRLEKVWANSEEQVIRCRKWYHFPDRRVRLNDPEKEDEIVFKIAVKYIKKILTL